MSTIIGLIILGIILISFEIIVPGGILGVLGGICLIGACVLTFQQYGMLGALGIFIGSLILVTVTLIIELKYLPKTKLGSSMFLKKSVEDQSTHTLGQDELLGKSGEALTRLAPTGKITIEGKPFEGFSQDGLIHKGESVKVVGRENFRILVKKI